MDVLAKANLQILMANSIKQSQVLCLGGMMEALLPNTKKSSALGREWRFPRSLSVTRDALVRTNDYNFLFYENPIFNFHYLGASLRND